MEYKHFGTPDAVDWARARHRYIREEWMEFRLTIIQVATVQNALLANGFAYFGSFALFKRSFTIQFRIKSWGSSTTFLLDGEIIYWKPYRNCKRWPKNVQIDRGGVSSLLHCYIPISEQPAFPASTQTHTRQSKGKQKYHRKINNDAIAQKFTIKFRLRNTRAHCWSKKEMQAHDIYTRMKCEMVRSLTLDPMALVFVWAQRNK